MTTTINNLRKRNIYKKCGAVHTYIYCTAVHTYIHTHIYTCTYIHNTQVVIGRIELQKRTQYLNLVGNREGTVPPYETHTSHLQTNKQTSHDIT